MIQLSNFPKNNKNSTRKLFFEILFISCYLSVDPNNWLSARRSNLSSKIETTDSLFPVPFGLKDKEPRPWDGSLKIIPNQKLQVDIDAFRVHDFRATGFGKKGIITKNIKLIEIKGENSHG